VGNCACACNSGGLVRQAGPSKAGSAAPSDDEVDPRLKNFEPRMIELIISEVLKVAVCCSCVHSIVGMLIYGSDEVDIPV